ncbi:AccI family restriction endonuclease [Dehalococcoidia bacterium]|nr:AccI family restriction endonuclease [Dehalococcoidia bacterium]
MLRGTKSHCSETSKSTQLDSFNLYLQLPTSELIWEIGGAVPLSPDEIDYLINPRRLRGSDFLMRWAQGRWSEEIVIRALNQTERFGVIPYGPSTVAPEEPEELELFFQKMDVINQEGKRPDLLLYDKATYDWARNEVERCLGSVEKVAETSSSLLEDVISRATAAIEVENSLWVTEKMPGFNKPFSRYQRGKNKGRLKPASIIPTIIVKQEDMPRLQQWEAHFGIPIYVVHIFYDRGYFIKFSDVLGMLESGELGMEAQRYTNPDGTAATPKSIVKVPYVLCKEFGTVSGQMRLPKTFVDKNGKVMTYVTFSGGDIQLSADVFETWRHTI